MEEKLGKVLKNLLKNWNLTEQYREKQALILWEKVLSPQLKGKTFAYRTRKGVLFVGVSSSTLLADLGLKKEQYRKKLNQLLGAELIKDIKFTPALDKNPRTSF